MDLKQLEYIVKIADEGNITRAAEKLYITQSALNQQLLRLEKELGMTLFRRSHSQCHLTEVGKIYVDSAKSILKQKQETYDKMYELADILKGKISIGFTPGRGINMFSKVYPLFHPTHTGISITPYELNVRNQIKLLESDDLDIGFLTLPRNNNKGTLEYMTLCTEEIFLAVPKRHPVAASYKKRSESFPTLNPALLKEEPFVMTNSSSTIREIIDPCIENAGFKPEILFETPDMDTISIMVENEMCCGFLPAYYVDISNPNIRYFSLPEKPCWDIVVAYKKNRYISKAAKDFIALAADYWSKSIISIE